MKKVIALFLAVLLAVSVVACSKPAPSPGTDNGAANSPAASSAVTNSPAASDAADKTEIVIGHYGPLTGPVSTSGQAGEMGARLRVKQINDAGGINGHKIKFIAYDDKSTAEGAVKAVTRLIDQDKVHALLGSQLSGNIQATGDLVEKAKIPEVGTGISPVWLQQGWTYLFRALANTEGGVVPLVDTMEMLKTTRLACITYQDEGSRVSAKLVMDEVRKRGTVEITTEEVFQPNDTDWTGQISKMIATNPNGILMFTQGEQAGTMLKQLRTMGYHGYVYGMEAFSLPDVRKVGGDAANGTVFYAQHCIPDAPEEANSPEEKAFLEAFVAEYGSMPASDVAYRTYDAMSILAKGFEDANSLEGPKVRDAIKNLHDFKVLAGMINYSQFDNGEGMTAQRRIFITHNGKNVLLDEFLKSNPIDAYKPN